MPYDSYSFWLMVIIQGRQWKNLSACACSLPAFHRLWCFQSKFDKSAINDGNRKQIGAYGCLMFAKWYAAKIVLIWVWFYWRSFDEQAAHGPHLLTWVNSYKSLSMHFSLLVAMFLPIYPFDCHSNQSNSAFWTKCIYSVEDYSSNISIKLLSTYLQWVRNKGLHSFSQSGGSSLFFSSTSSARGCFCSSASSLVDCVWASPLLTWSFTICSSSCIGIINIYFNTLLQRRLV